MQFAAPLETTLCRANLKPPEKPCAFLRHFPAHFQGQAGCLEALLSLDLKPFRFHWFREHISLLLTNKCTSAGLCSPVGSARSILICKAAGHLSSLGKCIVLEHFFIFFFSSPFLSGNAAISDGTAVVPGLTRPLHCIQQSKGGWSICLDEKRKEEEEEGEHGDFIEGQPARPCRLCH